MVLDLESLAGSQHGASTELRQMVELVSELRAAAADRELGCVVLVCSARSPEGVEKSTVWTRTLSHSQNGGALSEKEWNLNALLNSPGFWLKSLPIPVIIALDGETSLEMTTMLNNCDVVLSTPSAHFVAPQLIQNPCGNSNVKPASQLVNARTALDSGIVHHIVPNRKDLKDMAMKVAQAVCSNQFDAARMDSDSKHLLQVLASRLNAKRSTQRQTTRSRL